METTRVLANNIVSVDYEVLSTRAIEMTKKLILDSLACALAGSSAPGMKQLNELIKEWGGKKESTVVAFGGRVPSPAAALVNGSMGRALDFDDTHEVAGLHPAVPAVSAGFAIAEHRGIVGGKAFITAVALGIDLSCRMALASPVSMLEGYGWDYSCIYGYFSAVATSGKILGLSEDKLVNAMGIAYHQSSGNNCQIGLGYTSKAMGSGFAARGGVVSAVMAERGLTGCNECLAGSYGMYQLYLRGDYISERLTQGLGKTFKVEDDSFKPYPCCRCNHPFIDATLALVKENDIKPEDVERVLAYAGHGAYINIGEPLELKQNPPNPGAVQFSLPWAIAVAIAYRKAEVGHFGWEALKNNNIRQLAGRVIVQLDPQLTRRGIEPGIVEIQTNDGRRYSKRVEHALGHPENSLSMDGVAEKFRSSAGYAVKPISKEKLGQAIDMVEGLENVTDVGQIIRLLG